MHIRITDDRPISAPNSTAQRSMDNCGWLAMAVTTGSLAQLRVGHQAGQHRRHRDVQNVQIASEATC
jgi:hypothetical protein